MDPAPEAQTTDAVLMIRPCSFGWNAETADSNTYQSRPQEPPPRIQQQARQEFAGLRALLRQHGVTVTVLDDLPDPPAPDAVFPNNWFSTHADGTLVLYPMAAANRRGERRPTHLAALRQALGEVRMIDLTDFEASGKFLEGTGSLVLDRVHRIAYAAESARTDRVVAAHTGRGVIMAAMPEDAELMHPLLESPPAVFLGRICYGLYIWHHPIFLIMEDHMKLGLGTRVRGQHPRQREGQCRDKLVASDPDMAKIVPCEPEDASHEHCDPQPLDRVERLGKDQPGTDHGEQGAGTAHHGIDHSIGPAVIGHRP